MATVEVPLDRAMAGDLPPVCVMTGAPADGPIAIALERSWRQWTSKTVRLPMSKPSFRRWYRWHRIMIQTRVLAIGLVVGALALSAKTPLMSLLLLVGAGLVMAGSVRAERGLAGLQPAIERKRSVVVLHGVHQGFVEAFERQPFDSA